MKGECVWFSELTQFFMKANSFDYNNYYHNISSIYNDIRLDSKDDFLMTIDNILNACQGKTGTLLDIGCGTGKYGEALEKHGFIVTGIDKSPSQIQEAQKVINSQLGDVCQLPFGDNSFDVCIMIIMIHHLCKDKRIQAFKEVNRVLKPNGILIIKTASHEDLEYRISSRFFPEALSIDKKRYPTIQSLKNEMQCFETVICKPVVFTTQFNVAEMINKLEMRRTTNLGMLTNQELQKGLQRFKTYYKDISVATRESHYTFIIATKGKT